MIIGTSIFHLLRSLGREDKLTYHGSTYLIPHKGGLVSSSCNSAASESATGLLWKLGPQSKPPSAPLAKCVPTKASADNAKTASRQELSSAQPHMLHC